MSGQCSPVSERSETFGPRRSALDARLAIASHPAGLRLRGSLRICGPVLAGEGYEGRMTRVRTCPIVLPVSEIVRQYTDDKTPSCQLARIYDVSVRTIIRRLGAAGVNLKARRNSRSRRRGGPLHCDAKGYLQTSDRAGQLIRLHRGCWEACCGPVPEGYDIHHVDGNRQNNEIENLACMPRGEHARLHKRRTYTPG